KAGRLIDGRRVRGAEEEGERLVEGAVGRPGEHGRGGHVANGEGLGVGGAAAGLGGEDREAGRAVVREVGGGKDGGQLGDGDEGGGQGPAVELGDRSGQELAAGQRQGQVATALVRRVDTQASEHGRRTDHVERLREDTGLRRR